MGGLITGLGGYDWAIIFWGEGEGAKSTLAVGVWVAGLEWWPGRSMWVVC